MHLQKPPEAYVYRNQYIFSLPPEICRSRRRIQGSPGILAPPNLEPCLYCRSLMGVFMHACLLFAIAGMAPASMNGSGQQQGFVQGSHPPFPARTGKMSAMQIRYMYVHHSLIPFSISYFITPCSARRSSSVTLFRGLLGSV